MSRETKKDILTEGQCYWASSYYDSSRYLMKCTSLKKLAYPGIYYSTHPDYNKYYPSRPFAIKDYSFRPATDLEAHWLEVCIRENKYVPKASALATPSFTNDYQIY